MINYFSRSVISVAMLFAGSQAYALPEIERNNNFLNANPIGSLSSIGDTLSVDGGFGAGFGGASNDYFSFNLNNPLTVTVSFSSVEKKNGVAPVLSVFGYGTSATSPLYTNGSGPFTFSGVVGHSYFAKLSGGLKSQYTLNVAAVPEPETYAMMLAGLGLVGAIARRKKQSAQEAVAA